MAVGTTMPITGPLNIKVTSRQGQLLWSINAFDIVVIWARLAF